MADEISMLVGKLIATTEATKSALDKNSQSLESFSVELHKMSLGLAEFQEGLKHTNSDIMLLKQNLLTKEHLRRAGIDIDDAEETKADMEHLRDRRVLAAETKPYVREIKTAVLTAIIIGVLSYGWNMASNRVSFDPHKIEDKAK